MTTTSTGFDTDFATALVHRLRVTFQAGVTKPPAWRKQQLRLLRALLTDAVFFLNLPSVQPSADEPRSASTTPRGSGRPEARRGDDLRPRCSSPAGASSSAPAPAMTGPRVSPEPAGRLTAGAGLQGHRVGVMRTPSAAGRRRIRLEKRTRRPMSPYFFAISVR